MISIQRSTAPPPRIHGFTQVSTMFAGIERLFPDMSPQHKISTSWALHKILKLDGPGTATVEITRGGEKRKVSSYCKVSHILDPVRSMQGFYKNEQKGEQRKAKKIENPNNQAYVDALACVALGNIREQGKSPHFCLAYGVYKGIADTYRWDITEQYETYRNYKQFWEKRRAGLFTLYVERDDDSEDTISTTGRRLIETPDNQDLHDRAFTYKTVKDWSKSDIIESDEEFNTSLTPSELGTSSASAAANETNGIDLIEVQSLGVKTEATSVEIQERRIHTDGTEELEEIGSESEESNLYEIYCELKQYPVMIFFQEHMEGTLDDLLVSEVEGSDSESDSDADDESTGNSGDSAASSTSDVESGGSGGRSESELSEESEMERRWIAWTFQIVAAVSQMNGLLGLIHNDLHTNNIVYAETEEEYLYYRSSKGTLFKVPTYGILFRIIDFGRSTYTLEGKHYCSDDFAIGGDAEGQYNYGDIYNETKGDRVEPNPSFDLCRYASSVIEVLYPDAPEDREFAGVLNTEPCGWIQKETVSELYNLLWSWVISDDGMNVLRNKDGTERFEGFPLYPKIAKDVHSARACDQIHKPVFLPFQVDPVNLKGKETIYSLYD